MGINYRVATGVIIKEYLEEKNINEEELSKILGVSKLYISELLSGKNKLTEDIAVNLEKVLPEIPASYWLNLENKYREYLANECDKNNLEKFNLEEIAKKFKFKEVFKGLNWDLLKQANEMLKILKLNSFDDFNDVYSNLQVDFFEDGGEKEAIAIWLNLCKEEAELQTEDINGIEYSHEKLQQKLGLFKNIAYNTNLNSTLISCRKLCNQLGIYFVELEAISNSKVRGALLTYNDHPAIFISRRFKSHDHVWFAIAHELGHLLKHYNINEVLISLEEEQINNKEMEANEFAREFFISKKSYNEFIEKGDFSSKSIELFSAKNRILPGILVARLQHDKYIDMASLNYKKNR
ncbi:ImmA/IrrE family metallo-endopeptidase [Clostridium brassicae]|uniref:ImmA/IrrE family metallo-endopeptidase n=1 Tax=Clostridium brassicae TaxID=2999072 RepID=A0ABT4DCZ6_9CLOT|nr:ImmA/IrrE family metallo-endopeptidase [Clostridium brassicae]MCY6958894.1 ImmA/IrrE family metallo-endopeptidase [Clostridium brassicae]